MLHVRRKKSIVRSMERGPLASQIIDSFESMPAQLRAAARYILDRPSDVALLSMREQARQAGVQPATMTRLAKRLGLEGYDEVRELYAEAIRSNGLGFAGRAGAQVANQRAKGDRALAAEMVASLTSHIGRLAEPEVLDRLADAAALLASAKKVYCLGLRSAHPIAWQLHYMFSLFGEHTILLDSIAGTGTDPIRAATAKDVLFAVSVAPYTHATIETAQYAHLRGVPVVAVTDSAVSPLAQVARCTVQVPTDGPSFFHSMSSAFVVGEILAALVAGRGGEKALEALRHAEDQLTAFRIHWSPRDDRRV
jgi:DNA-binding MurR/RpiR family transcriptional regulator